VGLTPRFGRWVVAHAPATSANLGPGFDALGLALDWREAVRCALVGHEGLEVRASGPGAGQVPRDEGNLAVRAARRVLAAAGVPRVGLRVHLHLVLPVGRGLGSSAAAVAAGLVAANRLLDDPLSLDDLLALGTDIEGHPDNVAPALLGGFCAACIASEGAAGAPARRVLAVRLAPPPLAAVVAIPDRPLPTHLARQALPGQVPFADAVANVQRTALLVAGVAAGRMDVLREATQDRLHQPYRAGLVPGLADCLRGALDAGALGAFLSGAGPSVLALVPRDGPAPDAVARALRAGVRAAGGGEVRRLELAARGAWGEPADGPAGGA